MKISDVLCGKCRVRLVKKTLLAPMFSSIVLYAADGGDE